MRIQKYLSQKGICSRREAENYIREGRLKVDGKTATLGDRIVAAERITLDGKDVAIPATVSRVVLAFNKPKGVETTLSVSPEGNKTLLDFNFGVGRVFPIGRLDKSSHGLLLLTNDGALANQMMHPSFKKDKVYLVSLNKKVIQEDLEKLRSGVNINGKKTAPCHIEPLPKNILRITLHEGRNRQIRRMCGAFNYEVLDLKRVQFGEIELGDLKPGEWHSISHL